MPKAISNTSPLLYLCRGGVLGWLPELFSEVWVPDAVVLELGEGQRRGYDVPSPSDYGWLREVKPRAVPSEWLILDLGAGELVEAAPRQGAAVAQMQRTCATCLKSATRCCIRVHVHLVLSLWREITPHRRQR